MNNKAYVLYLRALQLCRKGDLSSLKQFCHSILQWTDLKTQFLRANCFRLFLVEQNRYNYLARGKWKYFPATLSSRISLKSVYGQAWTRLICNLIQAVYRNSWRSSLFHWRRSEPVSEILIPKTSLQAACHFLWTTASAWKTTLSDEVPPVPSLPVLLTGLHWKAVSYMCPAVSPMGHAWDHRREKEPVEKLISAWFGQALCWTKLLVWHWEYSFAISGYYFKDSFMPHTRHTPLQCGDPEITESQKSRTQNFT